MSQQTSAKKCGKISYIELIALPFWVFGTRAIWDWVPVEWIVAAVLSFVAYLFVRKH